MSKPITIVGGGLAGLTLGIALRQQNIPVTLMEAGRYPRHRVCGEFISGRGQDVLEQLGLRQDLMKAGAMPARTVAFYCDGRKSIKTALPEPALCLSRFKIDALLAEKFKAIGGDLITDHRCLEKNFAEGWIRATGRRCESVSDGWRLLGLKVHASNVAAEADLEMHFRKDCYVGLCRIDPDTVNICGLFRSRTPLPGIAEEWTEMFRGEPGSALNDRLKDARFLRESFCSVAGLSLRPVPARTLPDCAIGDALTMIPPLTGNGMSLAFESAALCAPPLTGYAEGRLCWRDVQQKIAGQCDRQFAVRLKWAHWMQQILMNSWGRRFTFAGMRLAPALWPTLFQKTR